MKQALLLLFPLFSFQAIFGNEKENKKDFTLTVEFWPSFKNSSILTVSSHSKNKMSIKLEEIRYDGNYNSLPKEQFINLYKKVSKDNLLLSEEMKKYVETDSVYIRTLEKIIISDSKSIKNLLKFRLEKQESSTVPKDTLISDGIGLYFKYRINETINYFQFNYEINKDLMQYITDLTLKYFEENESVFYIEELTSYFNLGFQLRKTNNNPIEYKPLGVAHFEEYKSVQKNLKELPNNKPVILDFISYKGTDVFFDELEEFLETKQNYNIYILVNKHWKAKIDYYEYEWEGVKVFIDRENMMKYYKNYP